MFGTLATTREPGERGRNAPTPAEVLLGAVEDEQMDRRATAVRDFYRQSSLVTMNDTLLNGGN